MAAWLFGAPMWPWDTEREQGWESLLNPHLHQHCGAERPGKASNPPQLLLLYTKLILRCVHSSWETNSHHNSKKEAMLLSESWDKKDRAYLCGCMAAWHTVMSTLIKHGGHSQPSAEEGSALQARRSGPSNVSQILTGRSPCRQHTRLHLIGWNVSWVIIFVQWRLGQHCESQRQGRKISTELGLKPQNNMINMNIFDIQTPYNNVLKLQSVESCGSCLIWRL